MCSRFELNIDKTDLMKRYNEENILEKITFDNEIFPGQQILALSNEFRYMKWGIDVDFLNRPIINSRIEKIYTSNFFRDDFENRRCIIPATSFFEWSKVNKDKYKVFLPNEKIFSMAGIFREYKSKSQSICHLSILTTESFGKMKEIHDRMPIIIPKNYEKYYLSEPGEKVYEFLLENKVDVDLINLSNSQLTFL